MIDGTQDAYVTEIYKAVHMDIDWRTLCSTMQSKENYHNVREREFPHNWNHFARNIAAPMLTCREVLEKESIGFFTFHQQKPSQCHSWAYDESFAMKTAI